MEIGRGKVEMGREKAAIGREKVETGMRKVETGMVLTLERSQGQMRLTGLCAGLAVVLIREV